VENDVRRNQLEGDRTDLIWDGTGMDNDFARNECETSQPAGLCG